MTNEQQFWNWVAVNEARYNFLHQIEDGDEREQYLEELEQQLHLYCENLYFEVGGYPDEKQDLIITAQGDADFFNDAESLVKQAPNLQHWNVIALKPAVKGSSIEYDNIRLNAEDMSFIPLNNNNSQKIGLRVYVDNYNPVDKESFINATYLIVDNLLGEKSSAMDIGYIEIENRPPISERNELIELSKLPAYVKWKKNKTTA
ncbi:hypothetical protein [Pedobacter heparinus]|uniref:hypothetical protein n=1 Tax=Pedobacter heparinus TaxID=984 RepID=UPI00292E006B|nr:hypothetical protein [Pedobacter heparinus]